MTPAGARELTSSGHRVLVERDAGAGSSISDSEYRVAGASIVDEAVDLWGESEMVCKVKEPVDGGARPVAQGTAPVHLPPSGSEPRPHRCVAQVRSDLDRLRDGPVGRRVASAACPDERGGRPHGSARRLAPPDAARRRPGGAGMRRSRSAVRERRRARSGSRRYGRRNDGRRHARERLHPRP